MPLGAAIFCCGETASNHDGLGEIGTPLVIQRSTTDFLRHSLGDDPRSRQVVADLTVRSSRSRCSWRLCRRWTRRRGLCCGRQNGVVVGARASCSWTIHCWIATSPRDGRAAARRRPLISLVSENNTDVTGCSKISAKTFGVEDDVAILSVGSSVLEVDPAVRSQSRDETFGAQVEC